jgi:hypothetical protein
MPWIRARIKTSSMLQDHSVLIYYFEVKEMSALKAIRVTIQYLSTNKRCGESTFLPPLAAGLGKDIITR